RFVIASGYCWSSHLLLLSANSRFPDGLANRSGTVGRYMNGHRFVSATANIDDQTFPGQNMTHSLISREYFRCRTDKPFVRHDTRVWESAAGRDPRLRGADHTDRRVHQWDLDVRRAHAQIGRRDCAGLCVWLAHEMHHQKGNHEVTKTRSPHEEMYLRAFFVVSCLRGKKCSNHEGC